jgi:TctA family transporter
MGLGRTEQSRISLKSLLFFSVIVVLIQGGLGYITYSMFGDWGNRANFGEMFGGINTLFSGLAFAGVIYTILLQRTELESQRAAQRESDEALKQQLKTLEETAKLSAMATLSNVYNEQLKYLEEVGRAAGIRFTTDHVNTMTEVRDKYMKIIEMLEARIQNPE